MLKGIEARLGRWRDGVLPVALVAGAGCRGVEKSLCGFQIGRVEPLGEPVVDRLEERQGISGTALIAQQPGKARGGPQFPRQGALPASPVKRLPEVIFSLSRRGVWGWALQQNKFTLDVQQLGPA